MNEQDLFAQAASLGGEFKPEDEMLGEGGSGRTTWRVVGKTSKDSEYEDDQGETRSRSGWFKSHKDKENVYVREFKNLVIVDARTHQAHFTGESRVDCRGISTVGLATPICQGGINPTGMACNDCRYFKFNDEVPPMDQCRSSLALYVYDPAADEAQGQAELFIVSFPPTGFRVFREWLEKLRANRVKPWTVAVNIATNRTTGKENAVIFLPKIVSVRVVTKDELAVALVHRATVKGEIENSIIPRNQSRKVTSALDSAPVDDADVEDIFA